MTRHAILPSLAKINLDLRVLNKRADGFHELRTVFQTISLADTIEIEVEPAKRTTIELDDPLAIPDNLILRAAHLICDAIRFRGRVSFRLRKSIPMGGGLGGGSSNAAAVLLALPILAGRNLPLEKLVEIGAELGSDVPFFLTGGTAIAFGRGTEFYPLPDLVAEPILVAATGVHVATGPAYTALGRQLTFTGSSSRINGFQAYVRALDGMRSASAACGLSANDFEPVVFGQFPQLKKVERKLRGTGAAGVRMTGSGSAIVALFGSSADRDRARAKLVGDGMPGVAPASLISRKKYQAMWRKALGEHLGSESRSTGESLWPPRSRYAR
jgi:4-diphosphocytidyl-2-C-methyl-D-erythritol kinase